MSIRTHSNSNSPTGPLKAPHVPHAQLVGAGLVSTVAEANLDYYVISDIRSFIPSDVSKYSLLSDQWKHSPNRGMSVCNRYAIPDRHAEYEKDKVKGLVTCGNSMCPCCGAYKALDFAKKLELVMSKDSENYNYYMLTLTIDTSVRVSEQSRILRDSYSDFSKKIRQKYSKAGSSISIDWSSDITIDTVSTKVHLHRHAIAKIPKVSNKDDKEVIFNTWSSSVVKNGGRKPIRSAFYLEPVQTGEHAARYLFKAASEVARSAGKSNSYSSNRVSLWGLLKEIGNTSRKALIDTYKSIVYAMRGKRWFGISKATNEAYKSIIESEDYIEEIIEDKEDDRVVTPIVAKGNSHRVLCDSGSLPELMWVLKNKQDGDEELEELREIMFYLNQVEENLLSIKLYEYFKDEFRMWAGKVRFNWGS